MPVLPEVGSTMNMPGRRRPFSSASLIMAAPIRSFTELYGLKPSCLTAIRPGSPRPSRLSRINGVFPSVSARSR
jgi:hypothetical protein